MFLIVQVWLEAQGLEAWAVALSVGFMKVLVIIILSFLANFIAKKIILTALHVIINKTKNKWDDVFVKRKVFEKFSHLAPAWVIYTGVMIIFSSHDLLITGIQRIAVVYMIVIGFSVSQAVLNTCLEIYQTMDLSSKKPIQGYVQAVKIILNVLCVVFIISALTDKSPWGLLSLMGGLTAVIMLVFKDTILGFVASIQIVSNKMVAQGDWIEMPKYGADGDVIDISIHTVKVQNWDKTISTIPTYAFITNSFKNWKGMSESGGRRIKRSIRLDMSSVKFCTDEMLEKYRRFAFLSSYIDNKLKEISEANKNLSVDMSEMVNGRRLTNIGTFRAYIEEYLRNHPKIHKDMTFLVRQLVADQNGIPIEIYVFSNDQAWSNYEAIQADIFDHILAVIPEFDLRVFQNPTGSDFEAVLKK